MLSPQITHCQQVPLIHEVHADDQYLLNTIDGEWFEILHHFPWADYRHHAAAYYDALYQFNIEECEPPNSADELTPEIRTHKPKLVEINERAFEAGQAAEVANR